MKRDLKALFLVSCISVFALSGCNSLMRSTGSITEPIVLQTHDDAMVNDPKMIDRPTVIFVSIDGYRYDFNTMFTPKHLSAIEREGVSARSLKPAYPSKTLPNHYTAVTGLYPDRHGIVSNDFYDPIRQAYFKPSDRTAVEDGSWYGGDPLWNVIQRNGLRTASYMYFGSEALVGGSRSNFYFKYSDHVPNSARVDQVLEWMRLPEERRPHAIFLYFMTVDKAGHEKGLKHPDLRQAVLDVDDQIGRLRQGLREMGKPVDLIVVSDHGMMDVDSSRMILVDESAEAAQLLTKFIRNGLGPQMQLYLKKGEDPKSIDRLKQVLEAQARAKNQPFRVMRTKKELARLNYDSSPRVGDLVIEPDAPWLLALKSAMPVTSGGNHGWDPNVREMHGVFFAVGPSFRTGTLLPSFENIHLYPIVLEILGIKVPTGIDGKSDVAKTVLLPKPKKK